MSCLSSSTSSIAEKWSSELLIRRRNSPTYDCVAVGLDETEIYSSLREVGLVPGAKSNETAAYFESGTAL
jgi:hypothetical protein